MHDSDSISLHLSLNFSKKSLNAIKKDMMTQVLSMLVLGVHISHRIVSASYFSSIDYVLPRLYQKQHHVLYLQKSATR